MNVLRGNNGPRYRHTSADTAPYETVTVDKLTPIIGAEIGGVDLSAPLPNHQMAEIHRALAENSVIFFRDQTLTPEQHLSFGRSFGSLHVHPAAPHAPGHRELMIIHADKDSPRANGGRLAQRRLLRSGTADGQHPLHQAVPVGRRRYAVRQHVRRV